MNTASRLEGANKHLGTTICLSAATLAGCAPGTITRPIGRLLLKGKQKALMVYEPLAPDHPGTYAPNDEYCNAYALITGHGDEPNSKVSALDAFRDLAERFPDDPIRCPASGSAGEICVAVTTRSCCTRSRTSAPQQSLPPYFPPPRAWPDPTFVRDERRPKLRTPATYCGFHGRTSRNCSRRCQSDSLMT